MSPKNEFVAIGIGVSKLIVCFLQLALLSISEIVLGGIFVHQAGKLVEIWMCAFRVHPLIPVKPSDLRAGNCIAPAEKFARRASSKPVQICDDFHDDILRNIGGIIDPHFLKHTKVD